MLDVNWQLSTQPDIGSDKVESYPDMGSPTAAFDGLVQGGKSALVRLSEGVGRKVLNGFVRICDAETCVHIVTPRGAFGCSIPKNVYTGRIFFGYVPKLSTEGIKLKYLLSFNELVIGADSDGTFVSIKFWLFK